MSVNLAVWGEGCKIYEARCLIADLPTIENDSIDKAEILRLCNEIEDISCNISNQSMNYVVYADAQMIISKAREIVKELTGDARTD